MRDKRVSYISGLLLGGMLAMSAGVADARELRNPVSIGKAEVRLFGFKLYDASLLTVGGSRFDPAKPHALELTYARAFDRESLLEATRKEMQRIEGRRIEGRRGDHDAIIDRLRPCFRDVTEGDRFKATALGADRLAFSLNGAKTCEVNGPALANRFLAIWLSDNARDRRLSQKLRGGGQ